MKVIFLDVDGVLNSVKDKFSQTLETSSHLMLLGELVQRTNAEIVLSSSWRGVPSLRRVLDDKLHEVNVVIASVTRSLPGTRGVEIKDWLTDKNVDSFVILDDDDDMDEMTNTNLVLVNANNGLQRKDIEKALKILN